MIKGQKLPNDDKTVSFGEMKRVSLFVVQNGPFFGNMVAISPLLFVSFDQEINWVLLSSQLLLPCLPTRLYSVVLEELSGSASSVEWTQTFASETS